MIIYDNMCEFHGVNLGQGHGSHPIGRALVAVDLGQSLVVEESGEVLCGRKHRAIKWGLK